MFRPTKKRPNSRRVTTADSDDEAGAETRQIPKASKSKKKKIRTPPVAMSFDVVEDQKRTPKKERRPMIGYGGSRGTATSELEDEQNEDEHMVGTKDSLYGGDALQRLKSLQNYKKVEARQQQETESSNENNVPVPIGKSDPLGSFVPLRSSKDAIQEHVVVLAGDDALSYHEDNIASHVDVLKASSRLSDEAADDTNEWEAQLVQRSGIQTASNTNANKYPSLDHMRSQLSDTMATLQTQQQDLQQAQNRRFVEQEQTSGELKRYENELAEVGKALEFYQELRHELASWVGALRELSTKLKPVEQALLDLDAEMSPDWQQWQQDVIHLLSRAGILDRVLSIGHSLETHPDEKDVMVDEFGRNVKSQKAMERDKRVRKRMRCREEWERKRQEIPNTPSLDELSDSSFEKSEILAFRQRHEALLEALELAKAGLDEKYTSFAKLVQIFGKWQKLHGQEYKEAFAGLSLGDLAGALVRLDMCSDYHPLHWLDPRTDTKDNTLKRLYWFEQLELCSEQTDKHAVVNDVADKIVVPKVCQLLDKGAYSELSAKQSRSLSSFYSQLCYLLPEGSDHSRRLKSKVTQHFIAVLHKVALPIVVGKAREAVNVDDNTNESLCYSTQGQAYRLKKILVNLLVYWAPLLGDSLSEPVLDFLSGPFLFLLSSLQEQGNGQVGSDIFEPVWSALMKTNWLDGEKHMIQTASLRAAATAYGEKDV